MRIPRLLLSPSHIKDWPSGASLQVSLHVQTIFLRKLLKNASSLKTNELPFAERHEEVTGCRYPFSVTYSYYLILRQKQGLRLRQTSPFTRAAPLYP